MNILMNQEKIPENSLRDMYYLLFRHKWKVVIFFLAAVFIITFVTFILPEIYVSEARLLVRLGRESVALDPTVTTNQYVSVFQSREQEINSEIEILRSRELAEMVIDKIGADIILSKPDEITADDSTTTGAARNTVRETRKRVRSLTSKPAHVLAQVDLLDELEERDRAILEIINNLNIEVGKQSNIISLSYEAKSAYLAHLVVEEMIDAYLEKHIEVYAPKGSYEFFTDQTTSLQKQLEETERNLVDLKNKTGVASLDEQRTNILERIHTIQGQIDTNSSERAATDSKVRELEQILDSLPEMVDSEKINANIYMHADLYKLQLKEQDLLSEFSEKSIEVKEVRRQIREATRLLDSNPQITEGINTTQKQIELDLLQARSELAALVSRADELNLLLSEARRELTNINNQEASLQQMERKRTIQENNYLKYYNNLEQARIDEELQKQKLSNISIIQSATLPMKPVRPNKLMNITLGFLLALFGSIGLAFFSEHLDHSIKTTRDIEERIKIRTLAVIPMQQEN